MQHTKPTLLWGMDDDGRVSALPASPLLLPALLTLGAIKIASWLYKPRPKAAGLPAGFDQQEYDAYSKEYHRLLSKITAGKQLTEMEQMRWNTVLPYPSWSQGERWVY